jgi:hypothetical protein
MVVGAEIVQADPGPRIHPEIGLRQQPRPSLSGSFQRIHKKNVGCAIRDASCKVSSMWSDVASMARP